MNVLHCIQRKLTNVINKNSVNMSEKSTYISPLLPIRRKIIILRETAQHLNIKRNNEANKK
jgi:hypothetical protein